MRGEAWKVDWAALGQRAARLLLAVVFLPYDTYVAAQAILVTLSRLLFSHRNLLTWTTAEQAARISPYRAGYLAADRRDIERRFTGGELDGLVATSAMELGVDVGDLDALQRVARLTLARSDVTQVLNAIDRTRVRAPADGTVRRAVPLSSNSRTPWVAQHKKASSFNVSPSARYSRRLLRFWMACRGLAPGQPP